MTLSKQPLIQQDMDSSVPVRDLTALIEAAIAVRARIEKGFTYLRQHRGDTAAIEAGRTKIDGLIVNDYADALDAIRAVRQEDTERLLNTLHLSLATDWEAGTPPGEITQTRLAYECLMDARSQQTLTRLLEHADKVSAPQTIGASGF